MNANKKIAINSIIIFIRLCVVSLVGIIASRYVLDALGASDYGLYNVVGGIVTLLNIFNTAMLSTTYRYLAFEIGKKENGKPNKVFSTSFFIHGAFALMILIFGIVIGDWYIDNYLNVDVSKLGDAHFVFHISILTTVISTLLVPYQGLLVAYEKFGVNAVIDIISNILRFIAILLFIYSDGNRIRIYSLIMFGFTFISGALYLLYSLKYYFDIVRLRLVREVELYKEMISYAFWTLFGAVAIIGKDQGSKILINFFFGTIVNAAYAVANQVESFILLFARSLSNAAIPQITKNYSGGNEGRSIKLTSYISKYTFFLMAIVAFPVILEMEFLLGLWLKEIPEGTTTFCKLIVLNGLLGCLGEGIPALVNATGNIKTYQIIYQGCNFLGLPIAFLFFYLGYNQYSILIIYCIVTIICAIVRLFLLKWIFKFDIKLFVITSYQKIFIISIPLVSFYYFYIPGSTVLESIKGIVISEIFLLFSIVLFGSDSTERNLILSKIKHRKIN